MRTTLTPAAVSTMTVTERLALDNLDTEAPSAVRERAFEIGRASALTFLPGWTPLFFDFGTIAKLIQPNWDEDLRVVCGLNQTGGRRKFVCLATCNAPCRHDPTEDLTRVDPSVGNWWVRDPLPPLRRRNFRLSTPQIFGPVWANWRRCCPGVSAPACIFLFCFSIPGPGRPPLRPFVPGPPSTPAAALFSFFVVTVQLGISSLLWHVFHFWI